MSAPLQYVHVVTVAGRDDGVYLFAYEPDALRFMDAVRRAGGECAADLSTPVCGRSVTDELIAQELTC